MTTPKPDWAQSIVPGVHAVLTTRQNVGGGRLSGIVVAADGDGAWLVLDQPRSVAWQVVTWDNIADVKLSVSSATVIRTYSGRSPADLNPAVAEEARLLGYAGYRLTNQVWAQGEYSCGEFAIALLLLVVLIGGLVLIYMLIVKPDGTLTATFNRESIQPAPVAVPAPMAGPNERLAALEQARAAGLVNDAEYADARRRIVGDF